MRDVLIGQTDYTVFVRITGTDGAPETGLAHTDIDIAYARVETDNDVTTSDVAPADLASLTAAHSDWGWEEVSSTDHPGLYRLDIADAVFSSGAWEAVVTITDASGSDFYAHDIGFRLVSVNWQDGVRLGLTALPNAAADAAGGLPISDAGGLDLDAQIGTKINDILTDTGTTLQGELDGIQADTEDIQTRLPAALVSGRIDASVGAMAANVMTAAAAAADLTTELQSGLATAAALATAQTSIDDIPTNAELATALGTADDAVLAAIAALNNLSQAAVRAAVGLASANLDDQLNALPTAAENATAVLAAGDVDGFTLEQTLKLCLAALAAKLSGAATATVVIRAADDSKDRITCTVDASGNRSAVTLDAAG